MASRGKMTALNTAVREVLPHLAETAYGNPHAEVSVRVVAFSTGAHWHVEAPTHPDELVWRDLEAPYEGAVTRVLLGRAARAAGDEEAAQLEFDAARTILAGLGAVADLERLERLAVGGEPAAASVGLTRRELEVLRLIAAGRSNRQIADELFLSERTVARHVSNILGKLGLPNRASATAFAFEHGLAATA